MGGRKESALIGARSFNIAVALILNGVFGSIRIGWLLFLGFQHFRFIFMGAATQHLAARYPKNSFFMTALAFC